eukprot:488319-Rhodomonas_salina.9
MLSFSSRRAQLHAHLQNHKTVLLRAASVPEDYAPTRSSSMLLCVGEGRGLREPRRPPPAASARARPGPVLSARNPTCLVQVYPDSVQKICCAQKRRTARLKRVGDSAWTWDVFVAELRAQKPNLDQRPDWYQAPASGTELLANVSIRYHELVLGMCWCEMVPPGVVATRDVGIG